MRIKIISWIAVRSLFDLTNQTDVEDYRRNSPIFRKGLDKNIKY
jgi:hypothetical protein